MGNDVRNHIYLPDKEEIWIDYLTGEKYAGGQVLNNFEGSIMEASGICEKRDNSSEI